MKELIKIAEEKGFESILSKLVLSFTIHNYFDHLLKDSTHASFLWMCELQKWLQDKYNIFAYIDWFTFEYVFIEHGKGIIRESIPNITSNIEDWQKWLPGLLLQALKIV